MEIVISDNTKQAKILGERMPDMDIGALDARELRTLVRAMRVKMREAHGVGLSANQVGLKLRLFVAEPPSEGRGRGKFYAVLNPRIVKRSKETETSEEGCLSIPGKHGSVARAERIVVSGFDVAGKPIKLKAWGFLARLFQHEIDHLDGYLISGRAPKMHDNESPDITKEDR
jgi:peptide deformylase